MPVNLTATSTIILIGSLLLVKVFAICRQTSCLTTFSDQGMNMILLSFYINIILKGMFTIVYMLKGSLFVTNIKGTVVPVTLTGLLVLPS